MKVFILLIALGFAFNSNAQNVYDDDVYLGINDRQHVKYDEIIEENIVSKNVLVRHNEVINYFHENNITENHYNINGRVIGFSRHRGPTNRHYGRNPTIVINENVGFSNGYQRLNSYDDNKWFFFFQLNSDFLTNKSELGHLIDFVKSNHHQIYIDSYADADTGNYDINMHISKARANTIINVLLKEGIDRCRIFVQYHGNTDLPYKTNNLNRCVIVTLKQ